MNHRVPPFEIAGPDEKPFILAVAKAAHFACEYGGEKSLSRGKNLASLKADKDEYAQFVRDCHHGFHLAQQVISEQVIGLEEQIRATKDLVRNFRRERNRSKVAQATHRLTVLRNRQLLCRRIADSIYFQLLAGQAHHYKRLIALRKIPNIDPDVLRPLLKFVEQRNRDNPLRFTLVADLTTSAHMIDLVELDRSAVEAPKLFFYEVKFGKTNRILLDLLTNPPDQAAFEKLQSIGPKACEQLDRMLRQAKRVADAQEIMRSDQGFDTLTQRKIQLNRDPVEIRRFFGQLIETCEEAYEKVVATRKIDECIRLVAIRSDCPFTVTDGLVLHFFYHTDPLREKCCLLEGNEAGLPAEVNEMLKFPPFMDLARFNLCNLTGPGLFGMLPPGLALLLAIGRLRLFMQFDVHRFFRDAQEHGFTLSWASEKESVGLCKSGISRPIPGAPHRSAAIHVQCRGETQGDLLHGFITRPFREFATSRDLIEMMKVRPPSDNFAESAGSESVDATDTKTPAPWQSSITSGARASL